MSCRRLKFDPSMRCRREGGGKRACRLESAAARTARDDQQDAAGRYRQFIAAIISGFLMALSPPKLTAEYGRTIKPRAILPVGLFVTLQAYVCPFTMMVPK